MSTKPSNRNLPVDTLRGLACIMLVAYHVIGMSPESGLRLYDGVLKESNEIFAYIRMPLFTFLSGLVYGWRPFSGNWKTFLNGKIRRLIIPMLVVGTGFALLQAVTPGTNYQLEDWRFLHLKPVAHYWFVESLFIIFIGMLMLEKYKLLDTRMKFAIIYLASATGFVTNLGTIWFSLAGVFYLFPFFLAGLYCTRFPLDFKYSQVTGYIVIITITLFLVFFSEHYISGRRSFLALLLGTGACVGLLLSRSQSTWLANIGYYSYSIYLFHVFFTAASRIALKGIGVTDIRILFICGLLAGLSGPVLIEVIATKFNYSRILLLGKRGLVPAR